MTFPLPLQVHGQSGLDFPWAFEGNFNLRLGGDGVTWTEVMVINWSDLQKAVVALLGYSWRDQSTVATVGVNQLRRKLPWQHPYFNQLWVKSITDVSGIRMVGTSEYPDDFENFDDSGGSPGIGVPLNRGPWTEFARARMSVQFWRPPYFVRSDTSIVDYSGGVYNGRQQEWLRYVDKVWSLGTQILSREGSQFNWSGDSQALTGLPGTVGQAVQHQKISRTWYELPEAAIFEMQNGVPVANADNFMYSQVVAYNPITGYTYAVGYPIPMAVNLPIGGALVAIRSATLTIGSPLLPGASTTGLALGNLVSGTGIPTGATISSLAPLTMIYNATANGANNISFYSDEDASLRLFGALMGTLRFDSVELRPRPLQLPPYLMQVPLFEDNEPISQQQYDATLHFDVFDPPRGSNGGAARGHNLLPWAGNGLWYPVNSQMGVSATTAPPFLTIHPYADLSQLFQIT